MNFSKKVRYALCALVELALSKADTPVRASRIASRQKIPEAYLDQLLLVLRRSNLVQSIRGKQGGFTLARDPGEITLLDIVTAVEGPVGCDSSSKAITDVQKAIKHVMEEVCAGITSSLQGATLQEICDLQRQSAKKTMYHI